MARMGSSKAGRRVRRQFSEEFRVGAVRLVLDEGKTVGAVARELDLTPSSLAKWVQQARADRSQGKTGLTTEERAELAMLRKDNRELRMERDILKKAAAGSKRRCNAGRLDRRGEGRVPDQHAVPGAAGVTEWVLCLARSPRVHARANRPALARPGARVVRREPAALREPSHSRGSDRASGPCQS